MLALFALVFGVCYGAYVALLPTIVMDLYGPRSVSGIIGCLYTGCGIGTLLGPWLAGVAYDSWAATSCRSSPARLFLGAPRRCVLPWYHGDKPKPSIAVSDARGVRSLHVGGEAIQSAMRLEDPYALALDYTRCMMGFMLFHPEPHEALMIGLGGGSLVKFFHRNLGKTVDPCLRWTSRVMLRGARALRAAAGRRALHDRDRRRRRRARARVLRRSR
jgi:MFS family permease